MEILAGLTFLFFLYTILYQCIIYWQVAYPRNRVPAPESGRLPSVSVVLCVTNEYKALKRILPVVLNQDYPCYEVVVVNDRSQDHSDILLRTFQEQYPYLQVRTTSTDDRFGRAPALALGMAIRAAQYDAILCLEPDCMVKDANWIRSMAACYGGKTEIVLGYTTHYKCPLWIRCDFLQHALHYLGRAAIGRPYTGTGSSLLFKKSLFYDHNGFNVRLTRAHFPLRVFIGEVAHQNNCRICTQPSGVTRSRMRFNTASWRRCRKMEQNSLILSPKRTKHPMLAESIIRLAFYAVCGTGLSLSSGRPELMLLFGLLPFFRILSVLFLYRSIRRKLDDKGLAVSFLLWDILSPFVCIYRAARL